MRILVTGGAGFIGSAVVHHLVREAGAEVLNIDKLTYAGNPASLAAVAGRANYRFARADIGDGAAVAAAIASFRPERIYHLAAETHVDRSIGSAGAFIDTNIAGTFTLLEAARSYWSALPKGEQAAFRFLHVSTDEVYGSRGPQGLSTEETRFDPSSPYSASKAASDHLVTAWQRTYGLPAIITNSSNNYGPRQFPEKLIPLTILNALDRRPLAVYGDGAQIRDWLHVEDHARALHLVGDRGRVGQRYNIGARAERRNIDVVAGVCAILDGLRPAAQPHAQLIRFVADRPGHDRRCAIDSARVERETGWRPRESFETGLKNTVAWYLANEAWWRPLRDNVYRGERLGILETTA
ncbi:MAG: dTDP-glucose 4,6-dehydratase [Proteobacteria bacterium]|nr:dTDP-glucose 4,6-dehydratase [Pseudomonadota bacterium]